MKKFMSLVLSVLFAASLISPAFAEGEQEDAQISCDAVNQASQNDTVTGQEASSDASDASGAAGV